MKNYKEYLKEIDYELNKLEKEQELFWCMWNINNLYEKCKDILINYFSEKQVLLIDNTVKYLWDIIDQGGKNDNDILYIKELYHLFLDMEEIILDLDNTDIIERGLYELITTLMGTLNSQFVPYDKWKHAASEAAINYLDVILDDQGLDILKEEVFMSELVQQEVKAQIQILKYLQKNKKVNSKMKYLFRE